MIQNLLLHLVYPGLNTVMDRGLVGYTGGKHFVRSGRRYTRTNIHWSCYADGRPGEWAHEVLEDEIFLCHFDAMSFTRWHRKFLYRRSRAPGSVLRPARIRAMALGEATSERGEAHMRKLYERLYCVSGWRLKLLEALGLAFRRDIFE